MVEATGRMTTELYVLSGLTENGTLPILQYVKLLYYIYYIIFDKTLEIYRLVL